MTAPSRVRADTIGPSFARWLLPLVFAAGWLTTAPYWQDLLPEFTLLMVLSAGALGLLLTRLRGEWWYEVHLWVMLTVLLLAYFTKMFVIIHLYEIGQV